MGLGIRAGERRWHVGIHKLRLRVAVVGAVESKGYLESFHGLYNAFDIKLVCSRPYRRRGLAVVGDKPTAVEGLADIALVGESEREVEAGRHGAVVLRLTEDIAYIGAEKRQRERAGVAVAHRHRAGRHYEAEGILAYLTGEALLILEHFEDGEFEVLLAAGEHLYAVVVDNLCLYAHGLALIGGVDGRHLDLVSAQVVLYGDGGVGFELESALEFTRFLLHGGLAGVGEALVDFLHDRNLVVERLEIDTSVGIPCGLVGNAVAHAYAVDGGAAVPAVCGGIAHTSGKEVEEGNARERSLV